MKADEYVAQANECIESRLFHLLRNQGIVRPIFDLALKELDVRLLGIVHLDDQMRSRFCLPNAFAYALIAAAGFFRLA